MMKALRLAGVLLTLGLGLTTTPVTGWAAPLSSGSRLNVSRAATVAPLWSQSPSGDLTVMLLDLFASVADSLTAYQDAAAAEAYLGSACDLPC
jgi:hypothetical protein